MHSSVRGGLAEVDSGTQWQWNIDELAELRLVFDRARACLACAVDGERLLQGGEHVDLVIALCDCPRATNFVLTPLVDDQPSADLFLRTCPKPGSPQARCPEAGCVTQE